MVNKYIKKRGQCYTPQLLQKALTLMSEDNSLRSVAKELCIQPMYLCRYIKKQNSGIDEKKPGRSTALPLHVEKALTEHLVVMAKWGFALSMEDVMNVTKEYVEQNALNVPFKNNMPGKYWFNHFCQRNKLSLKNMERLEKCRRIATSDPFIIYEFYDIVKRELEFLDLLEKPQNVCNLDETSFCIDANRGKLLSAIGQKAYKQQEGTGRENTTVMACVSAAGIALPPLFKGNNLWTNWKGDNDISLLCLERLYSFDRNSSNIHFKSMKFLHMMQKDVGLNNFFRPYMLA